MAESKLRDLSTDLAVKIIKICETIKGHYSLVNQQERSATSIGANIHETNYAHGKADFTAKLQIALKECYETEYWLELFVKIVNKGFFGFGNDVLYSIPLGGYYEASGYYQKAFNDFFKEN